MTTAHPLATAASELLIAPFRNQVYSKDPAVLFIGRATKTSASITMDFPRSTRFEYLPSSLCKSAFAYDVSRSDRSDHISDVTGDDEKVKAKLKEVADRSVDFWEPVSIFPFTVHRSSSHSRERTSTRHVKTHITRLESLRRHLGDTHNFTTF
jgi:hypothetical protein